MCHQVILPGTLKSTVLTFFFLSVMNCHLVSLQMRQHFELLVTFIAGKERIFSWRFPRAVPRCVLEQGLTAHGIVKNVFIRLAHTPTIRVREISFVNYVVTIISLYSNYKFTVTMKMGCKCKNKNVKQCCQHWINRKSY